MRNEQLQNKRELPKTSMFTKLIERLMFIEYRTHSCMIDYINEKIFKRLPIIVK